MSSLAGRPIVADNYLQPSSPAIEFCTVFEKKIDLCFIVLQGKLLPLLEKELLGKYFRSRISIIRKSKNFFSSDIKDTLLTMSFSEC